MNVAVWLAMTAALILAPQPAAAQSPDHPTVDVLLERLASSRDDNEAKQLSALILRAWMISGSDTIDLLIGRATDAMEDEELETALEILDEIVYLAPEFAEGWNKRATVYFMLRRYDQSMADVQRVLTLEPRHFGAISGLGMILKDVGRESAALEVFRKALEIHPFLSNAQRAVDELEVEVEGREI